MIKLNITTHLVLEKMEYSLKMLLLYCRASANIRAIEKRILDSIIGDGRYDSRIRPLGVSNLSLSAATAGKSMNMLSNL